MSKLRIGIIGAGYWGPNLIRKFHENDRSTVSLVCDEDAERLKVIHARYPGIEVVSNADVLIRSSKVDAIAISTPTATHFAMAHRSLQAGKHVFVEKPLATSSSDAKMLVGLAVEKSLKLMVGHTFLFNPAVSYLKQAIESKELGDLYYLHCTRTNLGPIRRDVNAWWDLASHDVAILTHLLNDSLKDLSIRGASFINPPIEDVVFASLKYRNGVFANIHVSWLDPQKVRQIVAVGSRKRLVFDDLNLETPIRIYDAEGECTSPHLPKEEPLRNECEAFLDAILLNRNQPSTGEFGLKVVEVLERGAQNLTAP